MQKQELACLSALDLLTSGDARIQTSHVLILDYDDTLFTRYFNDPTIDWDNGGEASLYLVGGEKTKKSLQELRDLGVVICIATKKNEEGAQEAVKAIKDEGMAHLFSFLVYDSNDDNKKRMLEACKTRFISSDGEKINYFFIDDKIENIHTANAQDIAGHHAQVNPQNEPRENAIYLSSCLEIIREIVQPQEAVADNSRLLVDVSRENVDANSPRSNPLKPQSRLFLDWLFSSIHINFLTAFILGLNNSDKNSGVKKTKNNIFKSILGFTYGYDGLDITTDEAIAANGEKRITREYPWILLLTSFFGVSNRPERFDEKGVPILTLRQFFKNMVGGWTLNSKTWTWIEILELPFKFFLVLPINILRIPVKTTINSVKIVTESVLIFFNGMLTLLSVVPATLLTIALKSDWRWYSKVIPSILLFVITLGFAAIQYAAMWAVRIGLILTSPGKSAHLAFALGRSIKIDWFGEEYESTISYIVGILGFVLSLSLTAVLWTILLPVIISAITTFVPGTIPALLWVSHLPFISASILWVSHLPIVTSAITAGSSLFAPVGAFLGLVFGPVVTLVAGLIGVQVTAMTMLVGTTVGLFAAVLGTVGSLVADKLSNLWIELHFRTPLKSIGKIFDGEGEPLLEIVTGDNDDSDKDDRVLQRQQSAVIASSVDGKDVSSPTSSPVVLPSTDTKVTQDVPAVSQVALELDNAALAALTEAQRRDLFAKSYQARLDQGNNASTGAPERRDDTLPQNTAPGIL